MAQHKPNDETVAANASISNTNIADTFEIICRLQNLQIEQSQSDENNNPCKRIIRRNGRVTRAQSIIDYTNVDVDEYIQKVIEMFSNQSQEFKLPKIETSWTVQKIDEFYNHYSYILALKISSMQETKTLNNAAKLRAIPNVVENRKCAPGEVNSFLLNNIDNDLLEFSKNFVREKPKHSCGTHCKKLPEEYAKFQAKLSSVDKNMSRFLRPFYFGFLRCEVVDHLTGAPASYYYLGPCGRKFETLAEIDEYLSLTKLHNKYLTIGDFTFSKNLNAPLIVMAAYNLHEDITNGLEERPIKFFNDFPGENYEASFTYINDTIFEKSFKHKPTHATSIHIECPCEIPSVVTGPNSEKKNNKKPKPFYDQKLLLKDHGIEFLSECGGINCHCDESCPNRVISLGLQYSLALKTVPNKGVGIFTLHFIPKGGYVSHYAGLIQNGELEEWVYNFNLHYPDNLKEIYKSIRMLSQLSLDELPDEVNLNSNDFGNFTRFINHSCEPNMICRPIYHGNYDKRFPKMCFFTTRDILPGEELTWNYNSIEMLKKFNCTCGSAKCLINPVRKSKTKTPKRKRSKPSNMPNGSSAEPAETGITMSPSSRTPMECLTESADIGITMSPSSQTPVVSRAKSKETSTMGSRSRRRKAEALKTIETSTMGSRSRRRKAEALKTIETSTMGSRSRRRKAEALKTIETSTMGSRSRRRKAEALKTIETESLDTMCLEGSNSMMANIKNFQSVNRNKAVKRVHKATACVNKSQKTEKHLCKLKDKVSANKIKLADWKQSIQDNKLKVFQSEQKVISTKKEKKKQEELECKIA